MRAMEASTRSGPDYDPFGSTPIPANATEAALAESGRSSPVYDVLDDANRRLAREQEEEAIGPTRARAAREDAALRAALLAHQQPPPVEEPTLADLARRPTHAEIRDAAEDSCRVMNEGREPTEGCLDREYDRLNDLQMGVAPPQPGVGPIDAAHPTRSLPEAYGEDWETIRNRMILARHGRGTVPGPQQVANARAANHLARGGPAMAVGGAAMTASHVIMDAPISTERVNRIGEVAAPIDNFLGAAGDTAEARNTRHLPMSRTSTIIGANDGTGPDTWGIPAVEQPPRTLDLLERPFGEHQARPAETHPRLVVDPQAAAAADADTADGLVSEILADHAAGRGTR